MSIIEPGTYRGVTDGLVFEFRVERGREGEVQAVSGDITRGPDFVGSFVCAMPQVTEAGRTLTGPLTFRGNPELFSGTLYLNADERGVGSFQVAVDLEGGYRDVFAGRLDWEGSFLRRLSIEIDGLEGTRPPVGYTGRNGSVTVQSAFEQAGFDVSIVVDPFRGGGTQTNRMRGFTLAEIHAAMTQKRSHVSADRLHAHVFVCSYLAGRGNRGVLGVMYDFGQYDLNARPREGVAVFYDHPMLSDPRIAEELRAREYVFTLVHEIGHALNLVHSFDKSRPAALSWMNYPHLYPRGYEAGRGYNGSLEFWRRFELRFDEEELRHLRHATPREIRAGGFPFGVYEEGASPLAGGTADPRRTRIGGNPLRTTRAVKLNVEPVKREYDLGEPVFLKIGVTNEGADAVHIPDSLDPSEGYVRLTIRHPTGKVTFYRPPVRLCKQAQLVHLPPEQKLPDYEGLPIFLSADGPVFTEPGNYQVVAELTGVDGSKNVYSQAAHIRVRPPDTPTEAFAHKLWAIPSALEALYLRHPLAERDAWKKAEEEINRAKLKGDNTTASYFNYIAGLGWMTPFVTPGTGEKAESLEKAVERISKVDPNGLPESVRTRQKELLEGQREAVSARRESSRRPMVIVTRPEEHLRTEVSPSGLFGGAGLAVDESPESIDPFERIVPSLRGERRFADVVSWNIEHLHNPSNAGKIPKIAELMRDFRCDFWGLQEVSKSSLARLSETLNSSGQVRYDFVAVEGDGQQSGAIFRTDTTRVNVLNLPQGFFGQKLTVEMADGSTTTKPVFPRKPLLCDVSVRQGEDKVFDFRCAVVHLKSTDFKYKDKGSSLRLAAAAELARWIQADMKEGLERDYIVMGDMNAETSQQGLKGFAESEDLKLLSVEMRGKYGEDALTRVASKRLLDHIVVTGDSITAMPEEDLEEQLIIRLDTKISEFTEKLSDHVPVAVRFIIDEDQD